MHIANEALAEFERSSVSGVWVGLNQKQIVAEMRSRLNNPFLVNQGGQPFCGPATIVFELIRRNPVEYVQLCRNLFQVGGFHTQTNRWISPSRRLRESRGNYQMPQVDWMVLSSLRESENLIFPIDPQAPELLRNLAGMTKSWEIAGWVREILGCQQVNYINAYLLRDSQIISHASQVVKQGGVALALINDSGLLLNTPPLLSYPSHWVALLENLSINSASHEISFEVYSWAKKINITVSEEKFKAHFWSVVIGY